EAAEGGTLALVEEADTIRIDIPERRIELVVDEAVLGERRRVIEARGEGAWQPLDRDRKVSIALQAYAAMATSADRGGVRDLSLLSRRRG
ncbi:MAG: dihydroxy-acid dehydratase, partial [Deltaproteobacteria bacterium]|nr:dihydroxy-acid dehydratase [Deltaproteobacteria bacterium]